MLSSDTADANSIQLDFPEMAVVPPARDLSVKAKVGFSDPAFASNKTLPIHRWVPWIAGFSSEFVRDSLSHYLPERGTVLDPFSGVGTTLVEASLQGHDVVGFEINPYPALACRAKLEAYQVDLPLFQSEIRRFLESCDDELAQAREPQSAPPPGFRTRDAFYSPLVLRKVLLLQDFILTIPDGPLRDLFRLAFAATMVRYSNYSYEPSLGRRVSSGKAEILDFAVAEAVADKLREMASDIAWAQDRISESIPSGSVINDSFFNYAHHLAPSSVDLVITSPPYLNNYHYNRNTRPQLYWLGYMEKPKDLQALEHANFGKYWQTVREMESVELTFMLPDSDIAERLGELRTLNPEKGLYGGHGWANYAASYFNDSVTLSQGLEYALKPGGTALVVIGNSIIQGMMIPTDRYFGQIAEMVGLELVKIHIPRGKRIGNSIIQSDVRVTKADDRHSLYEAVVEVRKLPV